MFYHVPGSISPVENINDFGFADTRTPCTRPRKRGRRCGRRLPRFFGTAPAERYFRFFLSPGLYSLTFVKP